MRLLKMLDRKDYDPKWVRDVRCAARAIIPCENGLILVKSGRDGYYKFPGGGVERTENAMQTAVRETREETGIVLLPQSLRLYGMVRETRKSLYGERIFEHTSLYYFAKASGRTTDMMLDDYERALDFRPVCVSVREAFETDMRCAGQYKSDFILREASVLELLLNEKRA